jgi:RHS repeat-associated protein
MLTRTGPSFYYTTDALGSVILLTDSAQNPAATYAYDSWGQTTTATGAQAAVNPWTYAGGYNDTTSNRIKFGARYYNPYRGRFTQPDPSSQETNRYAYAAANPINFSDSTGLSFLRDVLGDTVGSVVGVIGSFGVGLVTKSTPVGLAAGFALGCLGGLAEEAIAKEPAANYGYACLKGGVVGAVTGGLGGLLGKAFPK